MATLSAIRFYDLVERIFAPRRNVGHVVFDICKVEYPAVRRLAENDVPSSEVIDQAWLRRAELCGHDAVVRFLSENNAQQPNSILALLVDERCGLIASHQISTAPHFEVAKAVANILEAASRHHARGIILATHELDPKLASYADRERLTIDLYRKGEVMDVCLLDHFVLTDGVWKRMFVIRSARQS